MSNEYIKVMYNLWLHTGVTLDELAQWNGVSKSFLSKKFTRLMNTGNRKRINDKYQYA